MKKLLILLFVIMTFTVAGCCTKDCPSGTHCDNNAGLTSDECVVDTSSSSSSATTSDDPFIDIVSYSGGVFTVDLYSYITNLATDTQIQSKITIRKGGFTGTQLSFTVTETIASYQYTLNTLSPAAVSGQTYYITFKAGTFYDTYDDSNGSVFAITIP